MFNKHSSRIQALELKLENAEANIQTLNARIWALLDYLKLDLSETPEVPKIPSKVVVVKKGKKGKPQLTTTDMVNQWNEIIKGSQANVVYGPYSYTTFGNKLK